jgi:hypothetical protein
LVQWFGVISGPVKTVHGARDSEQGRDDGASAARQSFREVNANNHGDRKKILWGVVVVVYIASCSV